MTMTSSSVTSILNSGLSDFVLISKSAAWLPPSTSSSIACILLSISSKNSNSVLLLLSSLKFSLISHLLVHRGRFGRVLLHGLLRLAHQLPAPEPDLLGLLEQRLDVDVQGDEPVEHLEQGGGRRRVWKVQER